MTKERATVTRQRPSCKVFVDLTSFCSPLPSASGEKIVARVEVDILSLPFFCPSWRDMWIESLKLAISRLESEK